MKNYLKIISMGLFMSACAPKCQTHKSSITGSLANVEWGGLMFQSCEVAIQIGGTSSNMDYSSGLDKNKCDEWTKLLGKTVKMEYDSYFWSNRTSTDDIITGLEVFQ